MNYVVTGGAGFIGQKLVRQLLTMEEVRDIFIIDDLHYMSKLEEKSVFMRWVEREQRLTFIRGNLASLSPEPFGVLGNTIGGVFHLASMNLQECQTSPDTGMQNNVGMMMNVLFYCCHTFPTKKLVFSSSASVYGDAVEEPMTESHPHNFQNVYGATKAAAEDLLQGYYYRFRKPGFEGSSLRYMNVYGPGMHARGTYVSVIIHVLRALYSGEEPVVYGTGEECFDFIHVDDVVQANIICMMGDKRGYAPYNVGTGVKTSINELVRMLMEITGKKSKIKLVPSDRDFAVTNRVCDPTALWGDTNCLYQLHEGLEDTVEWFDREWYEGRM